MWYGERDENDPRRGLLSTGRKEKINPEVDRIRARIKHILHAIKQCEIYNDNRSIELWEIELRSLYEKEKEHTRKDHE